MTSYREKHWRDWTAQDHADYIRYEAVRALRTAHHNGYRTAAEHDRAQAGLYSDLNRACAVVVW